MTVAGRSRLARYAACLAAALVLAGCRSAPTRVFTLGAVPGQPAAIPGDAPIGGAAPAIRIDAVHMPPALDRKEIVTYLGPDELQIRDLDQWPAPLGEVARQTLSADLVTRLPASRVIFPHLAKPPGTRGVTVDVLTLHADRDGASLQASWQVSATTGAAPGGAPGAVRVDTVELHVEMPQAGSDPRALTRALSVLLGQLADRIAGSVSGS